MKTWLITWNPQRYDWADFAHYIAAVEDYGSAVIGWSCGRTKAIEKGDRFFMLRQGPDPAGLFASGSIYKGPYLEQHWEDRRKKQLYVDLVFDVLNEKPLIERNILLSARTGYYAGAWRTQSSGVSIPPPIASKIERKWAQILGTNDLGFSDEDAGLESIHEGAVRRITVNAYERSSRARQACLAHHGYCCSVCDVLLEDIYGERGRNFIQVHHKKPLRQLKKRYKVDPIKDLIPVCPNCHAILHRGGKVLTVGEARRLLRLHDPKRT